MKTLRTIGKVTMALAGCAMMPVLIWVALGAAVVRREKAQTMTWAPAAR